MPTTKITKGGSFARAVKYDLEKGTNRADQEKIKNLPATKDEGAIKGFGEGQRARMLATNVAGDSAAEMAAEFKKVASQKPGIKEPVHKVSISIKSNEHLETHQWLAVGHSYLEAMGFADSPYLIAQHREKDHEHIHIVASRVDFNGKVVSDSFEKKRARAWAQSIEEQYDLSRTPEKAEEKGLTRVEIEQAVKTKTIPPKIVLQQSIKRTLAANRETPDFIEALERQNISIRVKTGEEKEILGISFGYAGKAFKGGSLGAKFTWEGLQKEGLNYEFERDYERLEEASRRSSRTEFESAGSKRTIERDGERDGKQCELGGAGIGNAEFAEARGNSRAKFGLGKEDGGNQSAIKSTSSSAGTKERISEQGDRTVETRHGNELRRFGRLDSGEIETARRVEPESEETIAAKNDFSAIKQQAIDWAYIDRQEYIRWLEEQRQQRLFRQSTDSGLYSEAEIEHTGSGLQQPTGAENRSGLRGTGTQDSALDAAGGGGISDTVSHSSMDRLADRSILQGNVGNHQDNSGTLDDNDNNVSIAADVHSDISNYNTNRGTGLLGTAISDPGDIQPASTDSMTGLSHKLRLSLDAAQATIKDTIETENLIEKEEIKKVEAAKQEEEFNLKIIRGRSR